MTWWIVWAQMLVVTGAGGVLVVGDLMVRARRFRAELVRTQAVVDELGTTVARLREMDAATRAPLRAAAFEDRDEAASAWAAHRDAERARRAAAREARMVRAGRLWERWARDEV